MTEEKKKCFVITPIGDDCSTIRRDTEGIIKAIIKPVLDPEYEIIVAHKINEQGTITKQIIQHIYLDELVIANLTGRNPNVMYELAFRHSLGKPVIIIAEKKTSIPFDIITERTIFYQNDALGVLELQDELRKALKSINFTEKRSPIYDILYSLNNDIKILELSEKTDPENMDTLKYILNRLDSIEKSVQLYSSSPSFPEEPSSNISAKIVFSYKNSDRFHTSKELRDEIYYNLNGLYPDMFLVFVDDIKLLVTFLTKTFPTGGLDKIIPGLQKVLEIIGLKDVILLTMSAVKS